MFDQLEHLSSGYRVVDYRFADPSAEGRFRSTQRPQGRLILHDLRRRVQALGVEVPMPQSSRSKFTMEMLEVPLEKYFTPVKMQYNADTLYSASRRVAKAFYVGKVRPRALEQSPFDETTSAGAPTFRRKGEVYKEEVKRAKRLIRGEAPPPVTVFHRGKNDTVARPVFGYPFAVTLMENRFFHPYQQELLRKQRTLYAGGRTAAQLGGDVNEMRWNSDWILELDYSGFDGSISARLIHLAFDIIKESFVMSEEEEEVWDYVVRYFVTCPVLLPDGRVLFGKRHGVPSGSAFTQLIGSIVNAICIEYAAIRTQTRISRYVVMGDDSIIGVKYNCPRFNKWIKAALELGISISTAKSHVKRSTEKVYFLGHFWNSFVGTRDRTESWLKILTPERVDSRYWAKDDEVRIDYYVERIHAYRVDNPDLWGELTRLLYYLTGKLFPQHGSNSTYAFKLGRAWQERSKFDAHARWFSRVLPRHTTMNTLFYFLRATPPITFDERQPES